MNPNPNDNHVVPLSSVQPGRWAKVREVRGGVGLNHRLASMGILVGTELMLVKGKRRGPIIVQVGESRYVLGRGMGHKIFVEQL